MNLSTCCLWFTQNTDQNGRLLSLSLDCTDSRSTLWLTSSNRHRVETDLSVNQLSKTSSIPNYSKPMRTSTKKHSIATRKNWTVVPNLKKSWIKSRSVFQNLRKTDHVHISDVAWKAMNFFVWISCTFILYFQIQYLNKNRAKLYLPEYSFLRAAIFFFI